MPDVRVSTACVCSYSVSVCPKRVWPGWRMRAPRACVSTVRECAHSVRGWVGECMPHVRVWPGWRVRAPPAFVPIACTCVCVPTKCVCERECPKCTRERQRAQHAGWTWRSERNAGWLQVCVCVCRERETDRDRGREEKRTEGERERGAPNLRVRVENVKGRHSGWLKVCVCERECVCV